MKHQPGLCFLTIILIISACTAPAVTPTAAPTPTAMPSPTPAPIATPTPETAVLARIQVDMARTRQTIREMGGGNFIHKFPQVTTALDTIGQMNVDRLGMRYVRVGIDLAGWEPVNDNDDPNTSDPAAFADTSFNHGTFLLLRQLSAQGVTLIGSVWDAPDWLVSNPTEKSERHIPPERYAEAIESLATWLLRARDVYSATVSYISFNEADIGINVLLSPQEQQALIKQAAPRFAELGLTTRWLLADAANVGGCQRYAGAIWQDVETRPGLGPLACHSWDVLQISDAQLEQLGQFAQKNELELWVTEGGWDAGLWRRSAEFPTWENAFNLAMVYSRMLKFSRAQVFLYWQMSGRDYNINNGQQPFPIMDIIAQFAREFPAGTQVVETSPNSFTLYSVAAAAPDHAAIHLINNNIRFQPVQIEGLPPGTYYHIQSTQNHTLEVVQEVSVGEPGVTIILAPRSVNVLSSQKL